MPKLKLHWQILIALGLAFVVGALLNDQTRVLGVHFYGLFEFVGTIFLNALKMIVVPLVVSSITVGVASIGSGGSMGRLGARTLGYYVVTSLFAILTGLVLVNLFEPGIIDGEPARDMIGLSQEQADLAAAKVGGRGAGDVRDVFLRIVPPNVFQAAVNGQMLGLIFFSLLYGFFMTRVSGARGKTQLEFWCGVQEIMMSVTEWVMRFAPIGVFALVAKTVAGIDKGNLDELAQSLGLFVLTVLLALLIHSCVTMAVILRSVGGVSPLRHYRAMSPALLTAFSTASSSATLPLTMECVEKRAGVSNKTASFVLPLGATVNMDGTALYECVAALFIAQAYGLDLTAGTQLTVVVIALLTSIGVAGVPSASLVAITVILTAIGLPLEALGLILAVDRVLDMVRTAVNVFGDSCGAVIIGVMEREKNILQQDPDLAEAAARPEACA